MASGWNETNGTTDHGQLTRYIRSLSPVALDYVKRDAREARDVNPQGRKAGFYSDVVCYCSMKQAGTL